MRARLTGITKGGRCEILSECLGIFSCCVFFLSAFLHLGVSVAVGCELFSESHYIRGSLYLRNLISCQCARRAHCVVLRQFSHKGHSQQTRSLEQVAMFPTPHIFIVSTYWRSALCEKSLCASSVVVCVSSSSAYVWFRLIFDVQPHETSEHHTRHSKCVITMCTRAQVTKHRCRL